MSTKCEACKQAFDDASHKKHHCRQCGIACCASCLQHVTVLGKDKPVKACPDCRANPEQALAKQKRLKDWKVKRASLSENKAAVPAGGNLSRAPSLVGINEGEGSRSASTSKLVLLECSGYILQKMENKIGFTGRFQAFRSKDSSGVWKRRFAAVQRDPPCKTSARGSTQTLLSGYHLTFYANRNDAETGKRLVDSIPLERAHVCMYERGYFPRVKNAYHFGMRQKGGDKTSIFEVDNEEDLKDWISCLINLKCEDDGTKTMPKMNPKSLKEGWIEKLGKSEKVSGYKGGWKPRYFVLLANPNRLEYFQRMEDIQANRSKNSIFLDDTTKVDPQPGEFFGNEHSVAITPQGSDRRFCVSFADGKDQKEWLDAIDLLRDSRSKLEETRKEAELLVQQANQEASLKKEEIKEQSDKVKQNLSALRQEQKAVEEIAEQVKRDRKSLEDDKRRLMAEIAEQKHVLVIERAKIAEEAERLGDLDLELNKEAAALKKERRRTKILLRITRKEQDQLKRQRLRYVEEKHDLDIEAARVEELYAKLEGASKTKMELETELAAKAKEMREREANIQRRERERERKDQLLAEFHYVLADS